MIEYKSLIKEKIGSEKNFGLVFAAVFLIVALYSLIGNILEIYMDGKNITDIYQLIVTGDSGIKYWAIWISISFLLLAYLAPKSLRIPNALWSKFGVVLGSIIGPIVMFFVYILTIVPIGLIFKLIGADLLNKKISKDAKTYWIKREEKSSMKNQF